MLVMMLDPKHNFSLPFQIICTMIDDYHSNFECPSQQIVRLLRDCLHGETEFKTGPSHLALFSDFVSSQKRPKPYGRSLLHPKRPSFSRLISLQLHLRRKIYRIAVLEPHFFSSRV